MIIRRRALPQLTALLDQFPAVVLTGPRQVGKTTLALQLAESRPSLYLDLESALDRDRLSDPEPFLASQSDRLVILDEVHRMPELFQSLRGLIDRARRAGRRSGQFLLLGSASIELLKQSGESLAGRVTYEELRPIDVLETDSSLRDELWSRGGFPESFLATGDVQSVTWRNAFIRTYLERDIPQFGPRIPATTLSRFWTMLAHRQGSLLNIAELARGLGVDGKTAAGYLDLLVDLLLARRLLPWHANVGKRLIKAPKVYVRDSGIVHALLNIPDLEGLFGHPVIGGSWEGFVIENLMAAAPVRTDVYFYRTATGAEIDLLLVFPGDRLWAVEVKRAMAPKIEKGFRIACEDLKPERRFVVYPGEETYPLDHDTQAIGLASLARLLVEKSAR